MYILSYRGVVVVLSDAISFEIGDSNWTSLSCDWIRRPKFELIAILFYYDIDRVYLRRTGNNVENTFAFCPSSVGPRKESNAIREVTTPSWWNCKYQLRLIYAWHIDK